MWWKDNNIWYIVEHNFQGKMLYLLLIKNIQGGHKKLMKTYDEINIWRAVNTITTKER